MQFTPSKLTLLIPLVASAIVNGMTLQERQPADPNAVVTPPVRCSLCPFPCKMGNKIFDFPLDNRAVPQDLDKDLHLVQTGQPYDTFEILITKTGATPETGIHSFLTISNAKGKKGDMYLVALGGFGNPATGGMTGGGFMFPFYLASGDQCRLPLSSLATEAMMRAFPSAGVFEGPK